MATTNWNWITRMKRETLNEFETLKVRVTVYTKQADGTQDPVLNLTGATMTCAIGVPDGLGLAGTVSLVDLANGVVDVAFLAIVAMEARQVVAQLKVARNAETQVAWQQGYTLAPGLVVT